MPVLQGAGIIHWKSAASTLVLSYKTGCFSYVGLRISGQEARMLLHDRRIGLRGILSCAAL